VIRESEHTNATALSSAPSAETMPHTAHAHRSEARFDLWRTVHRSLRGRYRITFLLATAGAVIGAWLGGMFGQRLYTATGLVRIASVMPAVMRETDQNRPIAMFEGYIQAQRDLIASPENIQAALDGPVWKRPSLARRAPSPEEFARGLKVETRQKSDHIRVTFASRDAALSSAAVQSIIEAYSVTFEREQSKTEGARQSQLIVRLDSLRGELAELQKEAESVAGGQTSEEIAALYTAAVERSRKLRSALGDVQATMAGAPSALGQQARAEQSPREMVAAELLRVNVAELGRIEIELERVRMRGYQPGHPQVARLEAALAQYRERVLRYTEECETWRSRRGDEASDMTLAEREAKLIAISKESSDELRRLSLAGDAVKALDEKSKKVRENIAATEARLDALRTEASAGSRFSIVSGGEKPMTAAIDNRHKMTAAGLVVGMFAPLAAMVLFGAVRYRYRFGDDLAGDLHGRAGMVAVLPRMAVDSHLGPASANCIHALRVRLQPKEQGKPRVYLVTSSATGDGKSSVAISLGLSFMAAGYRTLLVDADIASRHLSVEFGADAQAGLMEGVDGEDPNVLRMPTGLHFLAAGRGAAQRAFRLSPPGMARLLTHVRDRFDVIIIDGDPIVHGFASSLLAPNVDGVLLAASAGIERSAMLRTVRQVGALGGMLVAAILNHVVEGHFGAATDETYPAFARDAKLHPRLQRFGPLVASMMRSISYGRERDLEIALGDAEADRRPRTATDGEHRREAA
jgi:Mrp family chromosome partitioning ATPase/uncharacterized protein involved in exopolysaccharide biosynthesis